MLNYIFYGTDITSSRILTYIKYITGKNQIYTSTNFNIAKNYIWTWKNVKISKVGYKKFSLKEHKVS